MIDEPIANKNNRIRPYDIVAVILLFLIAAVYLDSVRYGIQSIDESYYFTITHRMALGDRLILDEWHVTQLVALFQYLPFKIFYSLTGSAEGVCLFFRYVYVWIKLIFYIFIYTSLRDHGWTALIAAFVFSGYNSLTFTTVNYYNSIDMAVVAAGIILFCKKNSTVFDLILSGVIFACGVVCAAGTALTYFIYSLFILISIIQNKRNKSFLKKFDFIINGRSWLWITIGIFITAVIVLTILFAGAGWSEIIANLAQIPKDTEYNSTTGTAKVFKFYKLRFVFRAMGIPGTIAVILLLLLVPFVISTIRKSESKKHIKAKEPAVVRLSLFFIAQLLIITAFISSLVNASIYPGYNASLSYFKPIFLALSGLYSYLLTRNKNYRAFAFLLFVGTASLGMDSTSEVAIFNVTIAACVPACILLADFIREIYADLDLSADNIKSIFHQTNKTNAVKRQNRLIMGVMILLILQISGEGYYFSFVRTWHTEDYHAYVLDDPEDYKLTSEIDKGPLKGLKTRPFLKQKYDDAADDIDLIRRSVSGRLYVADICSWYYLYADMPYSCYSTYYVEADGRTRTLDWWRLHPDKTPDVIYVPFFDWDHGIFTADKQKADDKVEWFDTVFDFNKIDGKAGYILLIDDCLI